MFDKISDCTKPRRRDVRREYVVRGHGSGGGPDAWVARLQTRHSRNRGRECRSRPNIALQYATTGEKVIIAMSSMVRCAVMVLDDGKQAW